MALLSMIWEVPEYKCMVLEFSVVLRAEEVLMVERYIQ